jgi:branched-chain amino acid transport system permease protein
MEMTNLSQIILNAISAGAIYALMALGLTLLLSVMDILFFAHGAMYMFGAYATFYLGTRLGLNYFLVIPIVMVIVGLIGVAIEKGFIRPIRADHTAILFMAIGLNWFFESLGFFIFGVRPKSVPAVFSGQVKIMGANISWERLFIIVVSIIAVVALHFFLTKTRWGLGIRAFAEDPLAAELQGISNDSICSLGFLLGSSLAALAGLLVAPLFYITPVMGSHAVLMSLIIIGLGGLGSIPGALIGAMIVGTIESLGSSYLGGHITHGLIFIFVVIFLTIRPTGLMGIERG